MWCVCVCVCVKRVQTYQLAVCEVQTGELTAAERTSEGRHALAACRRTHGKILYEFCCLARYAVRRRVRTGLRARKEPWAAGRLTLCELAVLEAELLQGLALGGGIRDGHPAVDVLQTRAQDTVRGARLPPRVYLRPGCAGPCTGP